MATSDASVWMNAAFALDELHQDADFRAMAADLEALEQQQQQPLLLRSPTVSQGRQCMAAFLSEMDQLSDNEHANRGEQRTKQHKAAAFMAPGVKPKPRKIKKLTTFERAKRDKALLQQQIGLMEQQIQRLRAEHCEKLAPIYAKRWTPVILHEQRQRKELEVEQLRLRERVQTEQLKAQALVDLIDRMRLLMQASGDTLASFRAQPQLQFAHEAAILDLLAWRVAVKYQRLDRDMLLPAKSTLTKEVNFGKVTADGAGVEYEFVHLTPFDVQMISKVGWECAKSDFGSNCTKLLRKTYAHDTMAIKQEFMVPIPNRRAVKIKVLAVCKQFKIDGRVAIVWEGLTQWQALTGETITSTHEHGSVGVQSASEDDSVSVIKGFVHLKHVSSSDTWLSLVHPTSALSTIVLPSYHNVIASRHQYVENRILDANRPIASVAVQ